MKKQSVPVSPLTTALSGSAKEVELRIRNIFQWKKKRPPLWAMLLTALAILSCGSLVSCQGREAEEEPPAPAVEEPPAPNVEEPPARTVEELAQRLQYDPDDSFQAFLDGLDLDGAGDHDDAVFAVSEHSEEIPYSDLTTQVTVLLGTGQVLTWSYKGSGFPEVLSLHLTSPDFQSLVLEVDDRTSNYGAACYFVLEVEDGALVERAHIGSWEALESDLLPEEAVLYGALAQDREDSPLQALRVPVLLDKWHAPCYYTLTWDGARFSIVPDDFFIDTEVLSLPNEVELTLELVGHWYLNDGSLDLYYSEVRVLEGDALLQTITPQFPLPQPRVFDEKTAVKVAPAEIHYPLHGFNTDFVYHTVDTRDINFDGCPDLGICCDDNSCAIHAWYLWDESSRQFQYAFPLYGDLILDESAQRLIEVRWGTDLNLYHYIEGQLCWIDPDSP